MPTYGIIEAVNILSNGFLCIITCMEYGSPNHLCFQCLKEGFNHGVVVAIAFAGHGGHDTIFLQLCLIIKGAILAATVRMMDQAF